MTSSPTVHTSGVTDERQANPKLCAILAKILPGWECDAERKGLIESHPALTPDLIFRNGASLILGEVKWKSVDSARASSLEEQAKSRLGLYLLGNLNPIEYCLAIQIPDSLSYLSHDQLSPALEKTEELEWALFTASEDNEPTRYPPNGWIQGNTRQLASFIEAIPLSKGVMEKLYTTLRRGVLAAGDELAHLSESSRTQIAQHLFTVSDDEFTMLMAATIVCNALLFQQQLENFIDGIALDQCYMELTPDQPDWVRLQAAWSRILERNYAPIFQISQSVLAEMYPSHRDRVLKILAKTARELHLHQLVPSFDLMGRVFQWLFPDRQMLATYYTLPETANLLAEIALDQLGFDWTTDFPAKGLVIADFACGTGTLLTSAYQSVVSRFGRAGIDAAQYHRSFMEDGLIGLDVLPTATHMTTANLAAIFPEIEFGKVRVATAPYGRDRLGSIFRQTDHHQTAYLGSLEFLVSEAGSALFDATEAISGISKTETGNFEAFELADGSVDLVIMNPPFSRQTHSRGDFIEPWAAFGTTREEQTLMNTRSKQIKGTFRNRFGMVGSGHAGIAPNFFDLGFLKLKPGGILAMVAPFTLIRGMSWKPTRDLLHTFFENITIITLVSPGNVGPVDEGRSFSADTGMAECLVIAQKKRTNLSPSQKAPELRMVTLFRRPENSVEAQSIAVALAKTGRAKTIYVGSTRVGEVHIGSWDDVAGSSGSADTELGRRLVDLTQGRFVFGEDSAQLPITTLEQLGERGPVHRNVGLPPLNGTPQEPGKTEAFRLLPISGGKPSLAPYQALWWSRTKPERGLTISPDLEAEPISGREEKVTGVWEGAARFHLLLEFRLTSNPLAACLTPAKSLGGSSWVTFVLEQEEWEIPLVLWCNTTMGLMLHWRTGSRQQGGRSRLTVSSASELSVFDVRILDQSQLETARLIFDQFDQLSFLDAHRAYEDDVRQALDRAVLEALCGLTGKQLNSALKELDSLRLAWCSEPTVHGGNRHRPSTSDQEH